MSNTIDLIEQHRAAESLIRAHHAILEEKKKLAELQERKKGLEKELKEYFTRQCGNRSADYRQQPFSVLYKGWVFLFFQYNNSIELLKASGCASPTTTDMPLFDKYIQVIQDLELCQKSNLDLAEKEYKKAVYDYMQVVKSPALVHDDYLILQNNGVTIQPLDLKL